MILTGPNSLRSGSKNQRASSLTWPAVAGGTFAPFLQSNSESRKCRVSRNSATRGARAPSDLLDPATALDGPGVGDEPVRGLVEGLADTGPHAPVDVGAPERGEGRHEGLARVAQPRGDHAAHVPGGSPQEPRREVEASPVAGP